jgi:glutamate dehydrogenase/leucine dehydrogenase
VDQFHGDNRNAFKQGKANLPHLGRGLHIGGKKCGDVGCSHGTIHDADGLNPEKLAWVMHLKNARRGRMQEYVDRWGGQYLKGQTPWGIPCDCAFPLTAFPA